MTDDPAPTDTGHWEIYAPLVEGSGTGADYEGSVGVELNYGAAPGLQLTVGLPADYVHDDSGFHWGRGDLELSAKYRFYYDDAAGLSIAAFPGVTLPTASRHGQLKVTPCCRSGHSGIWGLVDFRRRRLREINPDKSATIGRAESR